MSNKIHIKQLTSLNILKEFRQLMKNVPFGNTFIPIYL